jgi:hypothetical protein
MAVTLAGQADPGLSSKWPMSMRLASVIAVLNPTCGIWFLPSSRRRPGSSDFALYVRAPMQSKQIGSRPAPE